ncbi:methyltransferase domain-containing protein [Micromonospora sp. WMMD1128]|uniref:class I SAM-dependent methyltransferase n=1 Tax=unclassified Micromonospora TaxID=2617518 RepID=UPI00248ACFA0|nr:MULTISPECIES: class I SAM-dependent methyltransferase [unclassified Micromonospora]WBB75800.1 methyltransferase domain-containing protein [Micromonospora sp. WMMD1128]WFE36410.1 methyltransferase domain-containing protein [Micromonospora sp. WMMD975]
MTMPVPDRASVIEQQRQTWDSVSEGWQAWRESFERGGAPVTRGLLDAADLRPGDRVLDVGSGCGEPALSAARIVGRDGQVLGLDISPAMIEIARRRAVELPQARFEVGDLADLDLPEHSFDAVLSRWALMFLPDRAAALRALRRLLTPGGRLAAAVWGPADEAPAVGLAFRAIVPVVQGSTPPPPPPPDAPGPYAMSDPERCHAELTEAGFVDVRVERFRAPFWLESPETFVAYTKAMLPAPVLAMLRDRLGSADDPRLWAEVARLAGEHVAADGTVQLPSTVLLLSAVADKSS